MKNKILIFALIFILVLTNCICIFADDSALVEDVLADYPDLPTSYTYDNTTYHFYHYLLTEGNYTMVYCFTNPSYSSYLSSTSTISISPTNDYPIVRFELSGNGWIYSYLYSGDSTALSVDIGKIVYYSFDIYSNSDKTDLVFQGAPLLSVVGLTPNQITQQTTKEMVGLVPLVIGLAVLVIGLKKALQLLFRRFRQA